MEDLLHQFRHEDIEGAVIRILEDEVLSVNEFLAETLPIFESLAETSQNQQLIVQIQKQIRLYKQKSTLPR